jgi:hypothetical protein
MVRSIVKCAAVALTALAFASAQDRKQAKARGPDLYILDLKVQRDVRHVTVDGKVRVGQGRALKDITLIFEFFAPGGELLTKQEIQVNEGVLAPGEETTFHGQTLSPPRAVRVKLDAEADGRYIRIDKPGPYVIE